MFWLRYTEPILNVTRKRLSRGQFIMVLAALTGITSGAIAVLLKSSVHYIQQFLSSVSVFGWTYVFFPFVGILLTVWVIQQFFDGKLERGVPSVLYAIAQRSSFIPRVNTYLHAIASALTVGFGGSAGLEAPIVATGSAIGANYGKIYRTNYPERTLLLASGAAGGIAAAFNAPIAGVMFAIEVLLTEAAVSHFIPLLIASAAGALFSKLLLNEGILFAFSISDNLEAYHLPFYLLLGILAGLQSVYYARVTHWIESFFLRYKHHPYRRAALGGLALIIMCTFLPPLFSEGYSSLTFLAGNNPKMLLQHPFLPDLPETEWVLLILVAAISLLKVFATAITLASGGYGGNFAPSLFVGAYLGFFFARLINYFHWIRLPEASFTVVGMAGILSGVMHAPLTAIFLIAEITSGYALFIPLMIVASVALFISRHFEQYAMDTKKLATKGDIFTSDRDHNVLTRLKLTKLLEKDVATVYPDGTLEDLVEAIRNSKRNLFAVVERSGRFVGVITLDDVKDVIFDRELYHWLVIEDVMTRPPVTLEVQEDMESVMKKFEETNSWNLPVIENGQYLGIVSKSGIFNQYRQSLSAPREVL
ncbi:MAG TPA: chloride channel protein [Bacteroidetes bacterium]|nr:chloride channel protein [Bacteroidota bacterium]HRR07677.1 chloride channel protein [Rhodothermales bacterium]